MDDLISVIVPVYNVKDYLQECIESIKKQTYNNLEIIVVDDGSTDGSGELCDKLSLTDSRISVYHKKNGGLSDARNFGIKMAKGTYVGFVDSDDYISRDMYMTLWMMCKKYNTEIACARFKTVGDVLSKMVPDETLIEEVLPWDVALNSILSGNSSTKRYITISVWDRLYKKKLIDGIEFPAGRCYEDIMFTTKVFERAQTVAYVNRSLYYYRIRFGSITNNNLNFTNLFLKDNLAFRKEQIVFLHDKGKLETSVLAKCYFLSDLFYIRKSITDDMKEIYKKYFIEGTPSICEILSAKHSVMNRVKLLIKYCVVRKYVNN